MCAFSLFVSKLRRNLDNACKSKILVQCCDVMQDTNFLKIPFAMDCSALDYDNSRACHTAYLPNLIGMDSLYQVGHAGKAAIL